MFSIGTPGPEIRDVSDAALVTAHRGCIEESKAVADRLLQIKSGCTPAALNKISSSYARQRSPKHI
jgi:hypothetical protein